MERIARHYDKVILTLIMCLVILFMATFSPFAEAANAIAVVDDAIVAIVVVALAAMGITFVTTGAFTSSTDFTRSLMDEYATANNTTVEEQLRGVQAATNKLGQILMNNRFVVYLDGFVRFIKAKFNLANNSTKIVQIAGYAFGELTVYFADSGYDFNLQYDNLYKYVYYFPKPVLVVFDSGHPGASNDVTMYAITNTAGDIQVRRTRNRVNGDYLAETTLNVTMSQTGTIGGIQVDSTKYWGTMDTYNGSAFWIAGYQTNSYQDIAATLNDSNAQIANQSQIQAITDVILPPLDDDNYTEGDGAVIDLDAGWGTTYDDLTGEVIPTDFSDAQEGDASIEYVAEDEVAEQVEETQETTNLPAGVIPFAPLSLPTFKLLSIWHYVRQWIEDTAIAASSLMAIASQAPHPMVNLFYAIACLALIFGFIKGMAK